MGCRNDSHVHVNMALTTDSFYLVILQDAQCIQLMRDFIAQRPELWNEDIGV